jgi:hypothetical protein
MVAAILAIPLLSGVTGEGQDRASSEDRACQMDSVKCCAGSAQLVPLVLEDDQIFRPCRVEGKMCDCVSDRGVDRIVQLGFKILSVFSKHYFVTRAARVWRNGHRAVSLLCWT